MGNSILVRAIRYNLVCIAGALLNLGILTLMTEAFGVYYLISNLVGMIAAVLWNYTGSIKWAWRKRLSPKATK